MILGMTEPFGEYLVIPGLTDERGRLLSLQKGTPMAKTAKERAQDLVDDLVALRDLLKDPKRWTRFTEARDVNGREVSATAPNAVCWCAYGGTRKVTDNSHRRQTALAHALEAAAEDLFPPNEADVIGINDGNNYPALHVKPRKAPKRHEKVMTLISGALRTARKELKAAA